MKTRMIGILSCVLIATGRVALADYSIQISSEGKSAIANRFNKGGNTLNEVLPNVPDGTELYTWSCALLAYQVDTYFDGLGWVDQNSNPSTAVLSPGKGAFIQNPTAAPLTLTFTGTQVIPVLPTTNFCGYGKFSLLACQTTNLGTFENITGFTPQTGDEVLRFDTTTQIFDDYIYLTGNIWITGSGFLTNPPVANIGESVFIRRPCPCFTMTCATNKTVPCGSTWSFDSPTNIIDTCCTNYSLSFSTVTNSGPCPLVVTRTWLVSDPCGHSNTCSQTVTADCCTQVFPGQGATFSQVDYFIDDTNGNGVPFTNSDTAEVEVNISELQSFSGFYSGGYLNIRNGTNGWLVQNMPIVQGFELYYPVLSSSLGMTNASGQLVTSHNFYVEISDQPRTSFSGIEATVPFSIGKTTFHAAGDKVEGAAVAPPAMPPAPGANLASFLLRLENKVTYQFNHQNVQAADNQCWPAAVANSFQWLHDTYGLPLVHENVLGLGDFASGDVNPAKSLVAQFDVAMMRNTTS